MTVMSDGLAAGIAAVYALLCFLPNQVEKGQKAGCKTEGSYCSRGRNCVYETCVNIKYTQGMKVLYKCLVCRLKDKQDDLAETDIDV